LQRVQSPMSSRMFSNVSFAILFMASNKDGPEERGSRSAFGGTVAARGQAFDNGRLIAGLGDVIPLVGLVCGAAVAEDNVDCGEAT